MEYNSPHNTYPSAPYYPPAFNVGFTSPLEPAMGPTGTQNSKSMQMQMQMNGMLNPANLMQGNNYNGPMPTPIPAPSAPPNPQPVQNTTQLIIGGPGMQYFSPSPNPISMTCPHCKHDIVTQLQHQTSCLTHMVAGVLCFIGCICCFYIPYLFDSFKDVEHTCPSCGRFIGIYKRM